MIFRINNVVQQATGFLHFFIENGGLTLKKAFALFVIGIIPLLLFIGCSGRTPPPTADMPDIDITVVAPQAPEELSPDDLLVAHFISVGDGDAILLVQGEYSMLIDGGPADMGTRVLQYLRSKGINSLDYIVATHPFADHVGGLPEVLRRVSVSNVFLPMIYHDTAAYNNFLLAVEESGAAVLAPFAGETFTLGRADIVILAPNPTDVWEHRANYSIVLRVEFGQTSFLLMGDAMREVEANLLNSDATLSADVLKVARHGASSATTRGFLDAVNPSIAVISAGRNSDFLSTEVLRRIEDVPAHVFRTDLNGNIIITSDGVRLSVTVEQGGR